MAEVLQKRETTKYIKKALESFAHENSVALDECDFTLVKTDTYIKSNANETFELFPKDKLKTYLQKERVLNEHIEFQQRYHIVLHKRKKSPLNLIYTLLLGKHVSHPTLILSPDSTIPSQHYKPQELLKLLFLELNKIKAYNEILVGVFDETMIKHLKVLVKHIYMKKFLKKVKVSLFEGIEPIITRKSQLIYWFEERESAQKSQYKEVLEGELLIEYKKPIFGKSGLSAYGYLINATYVTNDDDLQAQIDEDSIEIQEDSNSKKYIAKVQGYVHFNHNHLSVKNKILLDKISRNASQLSSKEHNNIEVTVSQFDTDRDSIGEGVHLKSESVHINGFVGAKSIIKASKLLIDGATHQNSLQYAKFATINRHKGKLRCHDAKIKLLEGGEVHATTVDIEACLGGTIYAQSVTIGHVKNNLKIYASHSIRVKLISGEDNLLHIGYKSIPILKSKIEFLEKEIDELKYTLEEVSRHTPQRMPQIKQEIATKKESINAISDSYKNATVTIEQPCRGLNTVIFQIDDAHELSYKTQAEAYSPFYLEFDEDTITLQPVKKSINI